MLGFVVDFHLTQKVECETIRASPKLGLFSNGVDSMLLTDEDVQERLASPNNLLNRLRAASAAKSVSPCLPPTSDDLNLNIDEKLAVGKLRENAASIMAMSLSQLKTRLSDIQKPETLARIAGEMNKVVQSRQDEEKKVAQIIVYAPQVIQENHFGEITLTDDA